MIKVDLDLKYNLDLSSKTVNIAPELHIAQKSEQTGDDLITLTGETLGSGEHSVKVTCPKGNIQLCRESWFTMTEN